MKKTTFQKLTSLIVLFLLLAPGTFAQKFALPNVPKGSVSHSFESNTLKSSALTDNYVFSDLLVMEGDGIRAYAGFDILNPAGIFPVVLPETPFDFILGNAGEMVMGEAFKFYSIDADFDIGGNYDTWLIDALSGSKTFLGAISGVSGPRIMGMALDHTTGVYYINDTFGNLYTVNMNTLVATLVGNFDIGTGNEAQFVAAISFDDSGNLFGYMTSYGFVFSIDKTNGDIIDIVAGDGIGGTIELAGMGWDPAAEKLVLTVWNSNTGVCEFRSVDLVNGTATLIGPIGFFPLLFPSCCIANLECVDMNVFLKNSNDELLAGGSLEFREGGGSGWQPATEIADGVFCVSPTTDRTQVGLRMTYGPQVQKVSAVPTNEAYTFRTVHVTAELKDEGIPVDGGLVKYTSNGWHTFGTTGDDGANSGTCSLEMLPVQYTFQMNYDGDKENKTELISDGNNLISFQLADLKSVGLNGADEFQLSTYPNPFTGNTTIAFTLDEAQEVNISVYDQTGRLVEILFDGYQTEGQFKISWDAGMANHGIYFIRMTTDKQVVNNRVVKM